MCVHYQPGGANSTIKDTLQAKSQLPPFSFSNPIFNPRSRCLRPRHGIHLFLLLHTHFVSGRLPTTSTLRLLASQYRTYLGLQPHLIRGCRLRRGRLLLLPCRLHNRDGPARLLIKRRTLLLIDGIRRLFACESFLGGCRCCAGSAPEEPGKGGDCYGEGYREPFFWVSFAIFFLRFFSIEMKPFDINGYLFDGPGLLLYGRGRRERRLTRGRFSEGPY